MTSYDKRWGKEDIHKAHNLIHSLKQTRYHHKKITKTYWSILAFVITYNLVISLVLMPLILLLKPVLLYSTLILIALSFGLLFELLLRTIGAHEKKLFRIINTIIPILTLINFFIIANLVSKLVSPLSVALTYTFFFILPYVFYTYIKK